MFVRNLSTKLDRLTVSHNVVPYPQGQKPDFPNGQRHTHSKLQPHLSVARPPICPTSCPASCKVLSAKPNPMPNHMLNHVSSPMTFPIRRFDFRHLFQQNSVTCSAPFLVPFRLQYGVSISDLFHSAISELKKVFFLMQGTPALWCTPSTFV